jgi:hypothetical protein
MARAVSSKDLKKMMDEADVNDDGKLDFKEFCAVVKRAENFDTSKAWMKAQAKIGEEIAAITRTKSNTKKQKA